MAKRASQKSILLVTSRTDSFVRAIQLHFSGLGWKVKRADNVEGCIKLVRKATPSLCVLDYSIPDAQRFLRRVRCSDSIDWFPFIVIFPYNRDPERADEFRICGDGHIAEPVSLYTLFVMTEDEMARISRSSRGFNRQICIQFPTVENYIGEAEQLVNRLITRSRLPREKQLGMNAAFREAILNAAQHGNCYAPERQISVIYQDDDRKVLLSVVDEGEGFDCRGYLKKTSRGDIISIARERLREGRLGGLGITLMVRCADKVEYQQNGNSVTIIQYL